MSKVKQALVDPTTHEQEALSYFHKPLFHKPQNNKGLLEAGVQNLENEIKRQQDKITSLQECLPLAM